MRIGDRQTGRTSCEDTEAQREDGHMATAAEFGAAAAELHAAGEGTSLQACFHQEGLQPSYHWVKELKDTDQISDHGYRT